MSWALRNRLRDAKAAERYRNAADEAEQAVTSSGAHAGPAERPPAGDSQDETEQS